VAERTERSGGWADYVIIVAVIWLAWMILANGMANALQAGRPEVALRFWGAHPGAGVQYAADKLRLKQPDLAVRIAREVIRREPLYVPAQRTLGLAYDAEKRPDLADRPLDFAGARSWRDSPSHGWLLQRRLVQGRVEAALEEGDSLLRRLPEGEPRNRLMALMVAAANTPQAAPALVKRLVRNPDWRRPFLQLLGQARDDRGGAHAVLAALARSPAPPSAEEYGPWVSRLVAQRRYGEAIAEWRAFSPRRSETFLRDGSFEGASDRTPFTWYLPDSAGAAASLEKAPERPHERALRIDWDGFSLPDLPSQLLALPPGRYRLAGESLSETQGQGRLRWRILCMPAGRLVLEVPAPTAGAWRAFHAEGDVPVEGCAAQSLALSPEPGERRSDQVAWFDRMSIVPLKVAETP
jgi:hypothetical protein